MWWGQDTLRRQWVILTQSNEEGGSGKRRGEHGREGEEVEKTECTLRQPATGMTSCRRMHTNLYPLQSFFLFLFTLYSYIFRGSHIGCPLGCP
jgi:hypothetical protein